MSFLRLSLNVSNPIERNNDQKVFLFEKHFQFERDNNFFENLFEIFNKILLYSDVVDLKISVETSHSPEIINLFKKKFYNIKFSYFETFTRRENQVFSLIAKGLTNREIAEKLFISVETVKSHRKHLLAKTGSRNTASLLKNYPEHYS